MMHGRSGFTLIELIVVLVIISVVMGIASPQLSRFYKGIKLDTTARRLRAMLIYARTVAVLEKNICRVRIGPSWKKITLSVRDKKSYLPVRKPIGRLVMPKGIKIIRLTVNQKYITPQTQVQWEIMPLVCPYEVCLWLATEDEEDKTKVILRGGSGLVTIEGQNEG